MTTIYKPPQLHQQLNHETERKITWLELFYDLVYVATLIQLGNVLSENLSWIGLGQFVLLFIPVWWAWTGITFYMNRFVVDDWLHRGLIFLQMCAIAWLGVTVEGAFGALTSQFSLTYAVIRGVLILLYLRTWHHVPQTKSLTQRYVVAHSVGVVLWVISAFLPAPINYTLWVMALMIEIGNAFLPKTRQLQSLLPPDPPHLTERYGIFIIIVLGESFIKTITAASGFAITMEAFTFSVFGIGVIFGLWWLYFDGVAEAEINQTHFAPYGWIYAHLPLAIGLTIVGVASKKLFLSVGKGYADEKYLLLFCGAMIVYTLSLVVLNYVTTQYNTTVSNNIRVGIRLGMAALFLGLALVVSHISLLGFIIIVFVMMMIQIGIELWQAR